jgi:hypothetical protein
MVLYSTIRGNRSDSQPIQSDFMKLDFVTFVIRLMLGLPVDRLLRDAVPYLLLCYCRGSATHVFIH